MSEKRIAIIGGGNLGRAIARGLAAADFCPPDAIFVTRRSATALAPLEAEGFRTSTDNVAAVAEAEIIVVAVRPAQANEVFDSLGPLDPDRQILISTITNVGIAAIVRHVPEGLPILRAMPNIGVTVGQSMTCLACHPGTPDAARQAAEDLFNALGRTLYIEEEQMTPATALCACGIAFFLRAIRAASQGGVQVGFHADEAIRLAAQTAKGAAELILAHDAHPEPLIDSVTTPLGVTIAGLNEMEHQGFSSALIRGIVVSAEKADRLYRASNDE
jgi:pyrroline-5-carboxylate reductase